MNFKPETIIVAIISAIIFTLSAVFLYFNPASVFSPEAKEIEQISEEVIKQDLFETKVK